MPITESSVVYEFPTDERNKRHLINKHEAKGRQWVSSSLKDGRTRMKFAIIGFKKEKPKPSEIDWNSEDPYEPVLKRVATVNRNRRRLVAYVGTERRGED